MASSTGGTRRAMQRSCLPFTEKVAKIIVGVVAVVLFGGYILYFGAKSELHSQAKDFDSLKSEYTELKSNFADIKSKYDNVSVDMKHLTDTAHDSDIKFQECQQKLNALEAKYDALRMSVPTTAPAAKPAASTSDTTTPATSSVSTTPTSTPDVSAATTTSSAPTTSTTPTSVP